MFENTSNKGKTLLLSILFLTGILVGACGMHVWMVSDLRSEMAGLKEKLFHTEKQLMVEKAKPPTIQTDTKTVTQLQYVPKETIIYRDPVTGQITQKKEATDVQLSVTNPVVNMKYNGRDYAVKGTPGENQKFENGKVVGEVSTTATIDVTELVNSELQHELAAAQRQWERNAPKKFGLTGGAMWTKNDGISPGVGVQWQPTAHTQTIVVGSKNAGYAGVGLAF